MRWYIATLILIFLLLTCSKRATAANYQEYQCFFRDATELEHQDKWKRIHWISDFNYAMAQAQRENKPLLVFLVVSFRGQVGATDC